MLRWVAWRVGSTCVSYAASRRRPCRNRYRPRRISATGSMSAASSRRTSASSTDRPASWRSGSSSNSAPSVAASCATRRSMPGVRRRAVRISWSLGGSTSPGCAVTALRVSSWRKRGTPAPRSTIRRHCSVSSPPSVSAATSPAASFSLSGSSSISRTDDAHGASSGSRLVMRIIAPGTPSVARIPNRSTVVGSAQWRSSTSTRVGVEAAVCASQATRARSVCWRRASASTSGRDHCSPASSPSSGASRATVSPSRPASSSRLTNSPSRSSGGWSG